MTFFIFLHGVEYTVSFTIEENNEVERQDA